MFRKLLRRVGVGLGLRRNKATALSRAEWPLDSDVALKTTAVGGAPVSGAASNNPPPLLPDKTRFIDLDLPQELQSAIAELNYQYCTPIQAAILPVLLTDQDAAGQSQTGTGKTAAFLVALFTRFLRQANQGSSQPGTPRALVLAPTRELAMQIRKEADALAAHTPIVTVAVFGGMDYEKQRRALEAGRVDLLVATPGRLIDFIGSKTISLGRVETLVIDEADRMMDMGFIPDVTRIVRRLPQRAQRRTWLFSATLSPEVMRLAARWMNEPKRVEIHPDKVTVDSIEQKVYIVPATRKLELLVYLLTRPEARRVIVFVNRRDTAERLVENLGRYDLKVAMLSGAVSQEKRIRTLEAFRTGQVPVVVATDVAGRGLHIEDVTHVINFNLPEDPEDYVHRIGRTGRVGASGRSVAFACEDESFLLPDIEKFIGRPLVYEQPPDDWFNVPPPKPRRPGSKPARRPTGGQAVARKHASSRAPARPRTRSSRARPARPHKPR